MTVQDLRIKWLECEIQRHANLYFVENNPEITDAEFDALVAELRSLDPNNATLKNVGAAPVPTYGQTVKHPVIMGSLNKASNADELFAWWVKMGCPEVVASQKMDGAAIRLAYKDGVLVEAATRGNGEIGQLCTDNAKVINGIPSNLSTIWTGEVRGEVYMTKSQFQKLVDGGMKLANCRNAAAGALGLQDPAEVAKRGLSFACYGSGGMDMWNADSLKLSIPAEFDNTCVTFSAACSTKADIEAVVSGWTNARTSLDYDIDGIVWSIRDRASLADAGVSGNCPVGRIAYKFATAQVKTKITAVTWYVGRTGKVTPLATMEAVRLAGSTVSSATLHSLNMAKELDAAVGDEVLLEKGGDIIPHIIRVTEKGHGSLVVPTNCPVCNSSLEIDGAHLWCINDTCSAKLEEKILFYLRTLDIKGIGPAFVSTVVSAGMVKKIIDLYCLDPNDVAALGVGTVTANQSIMAILDKHTVELPVFLDALGIHSLGTSSSKILAEKYRDLNTLFSLSVKDLAGIPGFGPAKAASIVNGLAAMKSDIVDLANILTVTMPALKLGGLTGSSFCLTGAMSKPRAELAKMIADKGGTVKDSVGRGLTYLVQADASSTSGKTVAAAKHGVKVISEVELMSMMA